MKKICDTILDAVGHTPMVRINRITKGVVKGTVYAKVETFNPGNSIKDRMAIQMIEDAPLVFDADHAFQHDGDLLELRALTRLEPS